MTISPRRTSISSSPNIIYTIITYFSKKVNTKKIKHKGRKNLKFQPEGSIINTQQNQYYLQDLKTLREAYSLGKVIEARAVKCDFNHDLHVRLGAIKGIIPRANGAIGLDNGSVRDIAVISKVNKPVSFVIDGFETLPDGSTVAILNRKTVQERCLEEYLSGLTNGDIIDARISHIESFGVFADIGAGISALLPIDSISVSRIPHPSARFKPNQDIKAIVKCRDEFGRIVLSHKELLGTWEENCQNFCAGDTVPGIVRSIEKYGIFVELAPNLAGLAEYTGDVFCDSCASVYIKSIIPERMKIKLIIVDCFDCPEENSNIKYYYKEDHISHWKYSPQNAEKTVETFF